MFVFVLFIGNVFPGELRFKNHMQTFIATAQMSILGEKNQQVLTYVNTNSLRTGLLTAYFNTNNES